MEPANLTACIAKLTKATSKQKWIPCEDVNFCICLENSFTRSCTDMATIRSRCTVRLYFVYNDCCLFTVCM